MKVRALLLSLSLVFSSQILATTVEMDTTEGKITIELNSEKAPLTVKNFLEYVRNEHYNGAIFHRVIKDFMIQGGGFDKTYKRLATKEPVKNETDNGLKNKRGAIAMARTTDPHSASAQFFINSKDNPALDHKKKSPYGWGYAVFGKVTDGMEVVDKISNMPTGTGGPFQQDVPKTSVIINQVIIIE